MPYVGVGLGQALAAKGPYSLSLTEFPGRVSEIKRALRVLGQKAGVADPLWQMLSNDDQWEEIACDEFVVFTSRYKGKYPCFAEPHFTFVDDMVVPTMNGLMLLDVAYRAETGWVWSWLGSLVTDCKTGASSAQTMGNLEAFLTGKTHAGETVNLNVEGAQGVAVGVPDPGLWGTRVSSDLPGYSDYRTVISTMQDTWRAMANATSETARAQMIDIQRMNRNAREAVAQNILNPPGGGSASTPVGTTVPAPAHQCATSGMQWSEAEQACVCPSPLVYDAPGNRCVCAAGTQFDATQGLCVAPKQASMVADVPSWVWIGAAGIGLALLVSKQKGGTKRGRAKTRSRKRSSGRRKRYSHWGYAR